MKHSVEQKIKNVNENKEKNQFILITKIRTKINENVCPVKHTT